MKKVHRSFATLALLALCLAAISLVPLSAAGPIQVRGPAAPDTEVGGPFVSEPVTPQRIDLDLRSLPAVEPWQPGDPVREIPRVLIPRLAPETGWPQPARPSLDPLLALQASTLPGIAGREFSTPTLNFEGIPYTGVHPPDTVGDVGPDHYIQMVNGSGGTPVIVFDKMGAVLAGPFYLDSLWPGGGSCASGYGDPIVLYDSLADRWLLSEFASSGNHLCVYISQTPDPVSGGWYGYDFQTPNFPDYPKYAVWPDAYYVSSNENSPAAYALDRSQMLTGAAATYQRFTAPDLQGFPFQALTPSDLDGATPPPMGTPNYFMRHRDDEVHNPGSNDPNYDFLEVWEFHVDFDNPGNSSFTQALDIAVTEFDSHLCGLVSFYCFPQPGTSTTLDPLREVVMWRLQYRNFGDHETLVGNLVTDVDGTDHGGIRWFELRQTGGNPWGLFQEGTYAPDAAHRWMGSIAMDGGGNMALGYSVSDAFSIYPSIRYVGRLASDPMGTMPQGEYTIIDGSGFQSPSTRWGDYSAMSVDPADDCTFWYTNEYLPPSGNWQTRIATFRFPGCVSSDFTLEANPDTLEVCAPDIVTSTIQVGEIMTYPHDVALAVLNVPAGVTDDIDPAVVPPPGEATLTLDVGDATADGEYGLVVSGTAQVTNVHTVGVDLLVSSGPPGAPVLLSPPDGATGLPYEDLTFTWALLPQVRNYRLQVDTSPTFPTPVVDVSGIPTGTYTLDTALQLATCYFWHAGGENACGEGDWSAPFHFATVALGVSFADDIESGDGQWSHQAAQGTDHWAISTDQSYSPTHSWHVPDDPVVTDSFLWNSDPVAVGSGSTLTFWHRHEFESSYDGAVLEISTDGGGSWTDLGPYITANGYNGTISTCCSNPLGGRQAWVSDQTTWTQVEVDLSSFAGEDVQIRWRIGCDYSVSDVGWYIDDVQITSPLPPNPAPTLLSIEPDAGSPDTQTPVIITGEAFLPTPVVMLDNTLLLSVTYVSSATLTAVVPADMTPGTYDLSVINGDCQEAVLQDAFTVGCPGDPEAAFTHNSPVELGQPMQFVSTVTGTGSISYTWDFGDGVGASVEANPVYTYPTFGEFTVTLGVADVCGSAEVSDTVEVLCFEPEGGWSSDSPVELGQPMHFTATITGTEPLDFAWDFDGPGTGSGLDTLTPVYTYTVSGDFLVSLVVTGPCGSEVVTGTVTANAPQFYVYLPLVRK